MKQRRKKVLSLLLAVACSLSIGSQGAAAVQQADTITDGTELSQLVQDYWEEDYFDQVVIDPDQETVTADGQETTLEASLGLRDTEAEQVMDSAQAAEDYFQGSPYEAEQTKAGTVIVTAPYQTKRLVVRTQTLSTSCGAEEVLYDAQTGQYYLQYTTQEDAQAAYEILSDRYGTDRCFVDQIVDAEEVLQAAPEDGIACYSWGAAFMGMDKLKMAVEDSDMTATATVAVVDTGVDTQHEFFANGRISEDSYSFASDSESGDDLFDGTGHGTHVAGIVADCTPANVKLMILRIFNRSGKSSATLMATAIYYAVQHEASVINISAGWDNGTANVFVRGILDPAIERAYEVGIPVVTAAGNKRMNVASTYPACNSYTIAVASLNREGEFDRYNSNYGEGIDFTAPGVNVCSAAVGGGICSKTGTSMAAPHVAAAAAYVKLFHPDYSVVQLYDELKSCSVDLGASGKDTKYGWGYPNLSEYSGQLRPKPRSCDDWEITLFPTSCVYDGTAQEPDVTVWVGEEKVPAQYYQVSYLNNNAAGQGTVVITGLAPYEGEAQRNFDITLATPKLASLQTDKNGVTVTWKTVPGAAGYLVERKQGDADWKAVKTVKGGKITRWMDSSNANGERYEYRIRAYYGTETSKASSAKAITYMAAPKVSSAKNTGKRTVTVTWKKNSKASGYQIQYGQTSKFKKLKTATVPKGKTTKAVLKKLTKKKTYYIRIRSYQTVNGKRSYSVWSTARSVIVKK